MLRCVAGDVSVVELKRSSMMQRLSGWMPTAIRGDHGAADVVLSLAVREVENGSFLFALCQDHKLRMWSITDKVGVKKFSDSLKNSFSSLLSL